jgi:ferric-dicitrate binding protein FerR (iron transport regulator)
MRDDLDDIDGPQLARYVSGQCTAEEAAVVRAWIAAAPDRTEFVAELEAAWRAGDAAPYEWGVDAGWRALNAAREGGRGAVLPIAPRLTPVQRTSVGWRTAAAVAALVLAVGSTVGLWRAGLHRTSPSPAAVPAMTEITTQRGQRATLHLADGTEVVLGMVSRLRIPRDFGETKRDVYLEGDGYFVVAHDSARPFAVHTARAIARDLGTSFGVRAYAASTTTEVAVATGAVSLSVSGGEAGYAPETVLLHADDIGRVDPQGQLTAIHDADIAAALAWTSGRLVFQDAPLRDVIAELGRWYDLDLQVRDSSVAARRLTASFSNESVPLVLERIALSLDLRVDRLGRTIVLRPRH